MELPCEGEVPPILQLQKWGPSEYQLQLSKFREGFISPTREILLLLSYHCEALLLPLARGELSNSFASLAISLASPTA